MMPWRRVLVESSWFRGSVVQAQKNLSLMMCGAMCMRHDWCQLWCHDQPHDCLLTSLIASASYRPLQADKSLFVCYTSKKFDFVVGSKVTSSDSIDDRRIRENLVDGIFTGNRYNSACVVQDNATTAWFLVDLGVPRLVSEVVLMAQPNEKASTYFRDIEVQVGDVPETGNFSSYTLLGTFVGPGTSHQEVVVRPRVPLTGRYVSIQKMSDDLLQIAHLEIR